MTQYQLAGRCSDGPSRWCLVHQLYIYSCSLYLHPAATTLLDMVQVIQPVVDATLYQWPWTDLADVSCSKFIGSCRFSNSALLVSSAYQLLGNFPTLPQHILLFSSACAILVTVSPSTFTGTNKAHMNTHTEEDNFMCSIMELNLCYIYFYMSDRH